MIRTMSPLMDTDDHQQIAHEATRWPVDSPLPRGLPQRATTACQPRKLEDLRLPSVRAEAGYSERRKDGATRRDRLSRWL